MSHLVTIQTQVRDVMALTQACAQRQLPMPEFRTVRLFQTEATGYAVELPDWRYPVVCDVTTGRLHYDHFQGRWGDIAHLHGLLQQYAVQKTRLEALRSGRQVLEHSLPDGSIRLQIAVG
ncbi:DUF1257 domain-containing protein [bacterium]|nr:DUF1257 domain-containing protein [bacterium]